jgi:hypothetical protein
LNASLTPGTSLDLNALDRAGQLTVPTAGSNPAQAAFVQPFIDRYGFLRNGVRTGGGIVGTSRFAVDDDDFYRKSGEIGFNYTLGTTNVTHDLHIGYQRSIDEEDRFQEPNGWGLISIPAGTINCPTNACGSPARPAFFQAQVLVRSVSDVSLIHSEFHSQNFEINDTIRMGDWTFNVGILASEDTLYGQGLREADNVAGYVGDPGNMRATRATTRPRTPTPVPRRGTAISSARSTSTSTRTACSSAASPSPPRRASCSSTTSIRAIPTST